MSMHQALVQKFNDSPSLASAAYCTWGWKGGLDVLAPLLAELQLLKSEKQASWNTPKLKLILESEINVYTPNGRRVVSLSDGERSFGGLLETQILGLTVCAIAHELGGAVAVKLFLNYVAEDLYDISDPHVINSFRVLLSDERRIKTILNEGQSLGLNDRFLAASNLINMPVGDRLSLAVNSSTTDLTEILFEGRTEAHMVAGLLRWLQGNRSNGTSYYTRSALVARTAAYLREVGWPIDNIYSWDGKESILSQAGAMSVVLVLGGDSDTDELEIPRQEHISEATLLQETVGEMLSASYGTMSYFCDPKVCQVFFDIAYNEISDNMHFHLAPGGRILEIMIEVEPLGLDSDASDLASSLAEIYFPRSADYFKDYYGELAIAFQRQKKDVEIIEKLTTELDTLIGSELPPDPRVVLFRAQTAAIVIAFFGGGFNTDGFENKNHLIALNLTSEDWLRKMFKIVDDGVTDGLGYWQAVWGLAVIHCAVDPENECHRDTIAWRNGAYGVLPRLMLQTSLELEALDICLIDEFWANVHPNEDGSIHTGWTDLSVVYTDFDDLIESSGDKALEDKYGVEFSEANYDAPEIDIQFSFERPLHYIKSQLSLVARKDGKPIGSTGVRDILVGILRSDCRHDIQACSGHETRPMSVVLHPRLWMKEERRKPFSKTRVNLIPVGEQMGLAIYLLGRNMWYKPKLVTGCPQCSFAFVFQERDEYKVAIGYREEFQPIS